MIFKHESASMCLFRIYHTLNYFYFQIIYRYGNSISAEGTLIASVIAWPWHGLVLIGAMTATIGAGMQALAGKISF